ncbi:hypothetical protein J1N35_008805 [Gossypium stocksii]|uniref:Uncharacterized protein n=1 Tax=Gossypium stocksii TaxID=47602 RepID=A0A9D3WA51_9ROSI|nr:hypothetical protein J1N35_008805 [Gossypium stocksii]
MVLVFMTARTATITITASDHSWCGHRRSGSEDANANAITIPTTPIALSATPFTCTPEPSTMAKYSNSILLFICTGCIPPICNTPSVQSTPTISHGFAFLPCPTYLHFDVGAFFINPYCTTTSNALQKVALLLSAAAFAHTLSIPLSFELKCAIWAVFLLPFLTAIIFTYLNTKTA